MWVDYRGPLSTVCNDGEISTCGQTIEVHSVQSARMGRSQHVGRSQRRTVCDDGEITTCIQTTDLHSAQPRI